MVANRNFELITRNARRDYGNLAWTTQHIIELVGLLIVEHHFIGSPSDQITEWDLLDCDQYRIRIIELDRLEDYDPSSSAPLMREARDYEASLEIFVKLSLDTDCEPAVGIISIHQSR